MSVQSMAIAVLLVSFLVMILLRFPIAYAVALSSLLCLLSQGLPLTTICQQMVKGISSFSLMAVPFFITMGVLMGTGGISDKLIALADACVGWMWICQYQTHIWRLHSQILLRLLFHLI